MSVLSTLFGGPKAISTMSHGQSQMHNQMGDTLNQMWGQSGPVWGGDRVAGVNPMMQTAFNRMPGMARENPAMQGAMSSALQGGGDPNGVQSMFQSALAPAREEFNRTLNDVSNRYGDTWGQPGALKEMTGRAVADYGNGLNSLLGQLTYQDRQAGMDRQLAAIPAVTQAQTGQMNNLHSMLNMGQAQRGIEQEQNLSDLSKWQEGQWWNNAALNQFLPMYMGTQTKAIGQQQGILPGLANAGMGIGKLATGIGGL